jgi:hypothetical protein
VRIKFTLDIKPFSINKAYYRDRRIKTRDFVDWELCVIQQLNRPEVQAQFKLLREAYDPKLHGFSASLRYYFPIDLLLNKQGLISSRAEDLSNVEKALLDLLFLPKIHVQAPPYGAQNVNCDDKAVLALHSYKLPSPDTAHHIGVTIRLVKLVNR